MPHGSKINESGLRDITLNFIKILKVNKDHNLKQGRQIYIFLILSNKN